MKQHLQELINKIPTELLIGDTWCEGFAGEIFDVLNPATEEKLTTLASATPEDAIATLNDMILFPVLVQKYQGL